MLQVLSFVGLMLLLVVLVLQVALVLRKAAAVDLGPVILRLEALERGQQQSAQALR